MENLGFKIRQLREFKNFTQEYISQKLNLSVRTYQRMESGQAPVSVFHSISLAKIFDLSVEQLMRFNPESYHHFGQQQLHQDQDDLVLRLQDEKSSLLNQLQIVRHEKERLFSILEKLLDHK